METLNYAQEMKHRGVTPRFAEGHSLCAVWLEMRLCALYRFKIMMYSQAWGCQYVRIFLLKLLNYRVAGQQ